jgi:hypothetical protein
MADKAVWTRIGFIHLSCLSLPRPTRYKAGEKMITQQRFDTLKQITEPREFYNTLLIDIVSIVREYREHLEAKAVSLCEKRMPYVKACEAVTQKTTKKRKKGNASIKPQPLPDDFFDSFDIFSKFHYGVYEGMMDLRGLRTTIFTPEDALLLAYGVVIFAFNKYAEERGETPIASELFSRIGTPTFEILQDDENLIEKQHCFPKVKTALIDALEMVNKDLAKLKPAETERNAKRGISAILISLIVICVFELSVWLMPFTPFIWLKNHPNSYGIQGSIVCLVPCLIFGFFKPRWRNWCWGTAGLAFLGLILSLLGGRSR